MHENALKKIFSPAKKNNTAEYKKGTEVSLCSLISYLFPHN